MTHDAVLPLILVSLAALLSPRLARASGLPVAVIEILLGVAIGAGGLAVVSQEASAFLRFLADLGFALFLFLAGLEVDFRQIRAQGPRALAAPAFAAVVSYALAFFVSARAGWGPWVPLAVGATSVPLLLSVVRELDLLRTPLGRGMVLAAAVGEVVTILLLSVADVGARSEAIVPALVGFARLSILFVAVLGGARVLQLLIWWFPDNFGAVLQGHDPSETGIRLGFTLMFVMVGLSVLAGIEPLIGAFFGGLMVAAVVRDRGPVEEKLGGMGYGFFIPVFFVHVGMRLHVAPGQLLADAGFIAQVVVAMLVVKLLPQLAWLPFGRSVRDAAATSALLAAPLTLVIAIADLGVRLGFLTTEREVSLIAAGMIASLVWPTLARSLLRTAAAKAT